MTYDILIRNGMLVAPGGVHPGSIGILEGRIAIIAEPAATGLKGRWELDAQGRYVVPGAIDTHAHIGQVAPEYEHLPGWTVSDNYHSETLAALSGGTTTALNYVRFGQESLIDAYEAARAEAEAHSHIDLLFHGYLMNELHLAELEKAVSQGIKSFKIFMPYRGAEAIRLGGLSSLTDVQMLSAFGRLQRAGAHAMVHAEDGDIVESCTHIMQSTLSQDLSSYEQSRPVYAEGHAALRALYLARQAQCPITIVHASSGEAVYSLKAIDYPLATLETCPHYLALSTTRPLGPLGKVAPPLRDQSQQDILWQAVKAGYLDFIGSDHNVWPKEAKQDLWAGKAGLPGIGLILPIMMTEGFVRREIPITRIVEMTSTNAAKLFGLWPRKGVLAIGADADIVVLDTGHRPVKSSDLYSMVNYSPYEGFDLQMWPYATIVAGTVVYWEASLTGEPVSARILNAP